MELLGAGEVALLAGAAEATGADMGAAPAGMVVDTGRLEEVEAIVVASEEVGVEAMLLTEPQTRSASDEPTIRRQLLFCCN